MVCVCVCGGRAPRDARGNEPQQQRSSSARDEGLRVRRWLDVTAQAKSG